MQRNKKYDPTQSKKTHELESSATVLPNCKTNTHCLQNFSYDNLVCTEQLFEISDHFGANSQKLFRCKHFDPKQWVNAALGRPGLFNFHSLLF